MNDYLFPVSILALFFIIIYVVMRLRKEED